MIRGSGDHNARLGSSVSIAETGRRISTSSISALVFSRAHQPGIWPHRAWRPARNLARRIRKKSAKSFVTPYGHSRLLSDAFRGLVGSATGDPGRGLGLPRMSRKTDQSFFLVNEDHTCSAGSNARRRRRCIAASVTPVNGTVSNSTTPAAPISIARSSRAQRRELGVGLGSDELRMRTSRAESGAEAGAQSKNPASSRLTGTHGHSRLLSDAFRGLVGSATGDPGRGLGLPRMREDAEQDRLSNLQVLTSDVVGSIVDLRFQTMGESLQGTAFSWRAGQNEGGQ